MTDNSDINYNLLEPKIFSLPKKPEIKESNNRVQQSNSNLNQILPRRRVKNTSQNFEIGPDVFSTNHISANNTEPILPNKNDLFSTMDGLNKLFQILGLKESVLKVFGTEKILIISILAILKIWIRNKFPILNRLVFREKYSSLIINYVHYTSSYYSSQNSEADSLLYKSLLYYTIKKNINGIKYVINNSGNVNNFDKNIEIKINSNIFIDTKTTISSTSINYEVEMYSYTLRQDKVRSFLNKCVNYYKKHLLNTVNYSVGNPTQRYYNYMNFNTQTNTAIFEDSKFYSNKTFDNIFFENKEMFLRKINYFCNNRASYRELGVPYSLGIILYGSPGTGKTSCIKALANLTGRSVVDLNLSRIKTYKELKSAFLDLKINNVEVAPDKRIYVFEEFDCIIDKVKQRTLNEITKNNQTNISNLGNLGNSEELYETNGYNSREIVGEIPGDTPITIGTLLNCLDGTLESNGHIICLTTNFIDKIDKALVRPGRFDCHIHLENSTPKIILEMINHFYNKEKNKVPVDKFIPNYEKVLENIKTYAYYNGKTVWSPAKITQICLSYIDEPKYLSNILNYLKDNYDSELKLLEIITNSTKV